MDNKYKQVAVILLMTVIFYSFIQNKRSTRLQKKIKDAIINTYEIEDFELQPILISAEINKNTPIELRKDNLFIIKKGSKKHGYVYIGKSSSMKNLFDYIVLFNNNLTIKKSKVLIYREDYGKQIGSQRWLKQFIGLSIDNVLIYGENIDAISGATISASSMTRAINNILKSVKILKEKEIL